ncbi:MAG: hypothetical protein A2W26_09130 [Acidobacteria bacterium RBG_16_64_8]|nr:MAG: hypothetical protein A2W26_09130 [Acidobacteria bacterium RBG_16_64_8]
MERAQVLVIAAVVAAVGLFGLRFLGSPGSVEPGTVLSRREHRSVASDPLDPRRSSGEQTGSALNGEGSGERFGTDVNRRFDSDPSAVRPRGGSAEARAAGRGSRGGKIGVSASTRRAGDSGSRVSLGADASLSRRAELNIPKRADLVEFLASQSASGDEAGGDVPIGGEVALEVKTTEDIAPAIVKRGVEAPELNEEGLTFTDSSMLAFPDAGNASGEGGTISFEIEPQWAGADETNNSLVQIRREHQWSDRLELVKNGRYLRFIVTDSEGHEADISVRIDQWPAGERHDIQAQWGKGLTTLWIDGEPVGSNVYSGNLRFSGGTPLYLGSDYPSSNYTGFNGTLRNFRLTTDAATRQQSG